MFGVQQHNAPGHVLCCMCGVGMPPNPAGMCVDCIRSQVRPAASPPPPLAAAPGLHRVRQTCVASTLPGAPNTVE